jgi:polyhydroxyalkanoate synthesis regulator phasin
MADPIDMIMPMLREMRAENEARHGEVLSRFERVERRLDKLEDAQRSFKNALSADTLMSKLVTGDFEERIEALEAKVRELLETRR